jgi:hypothetical protein
MLELLFEIFGEFLLQAVLEIFAEFGMRLVAEPFRKAPNAWLAAIGYMLFGAVAGAISLWLFPVHWVKGDTLRLVNLGMTPVLTGLLMSVIGRWRAHRDQELLRIDRFSYGYLFALSLGLVRFYFAQ